MEPQVFMLIDGGLCVVSVFCDKTFRTEITTKQYPINAHPLLGRGLEWFYPSVMEREKDNVVYKRRGRFLELKKASPCAKESISWK